MKYFLAIAVTLLILVSGCQQPKQSSDEVYCNAISIDECKEEDRCKLGGSCPVCADIACHSKDYDKDWIPVMSESYIACECGCCGGTEPAETVCLYASQGDTIQKIMEEDQIASQQSICTVAGCSLGIKYIYCD